MKKPRKVIHKMKDLSKILEGILFLAGDSIAEEDIKSRLEVTPEEFEEAVKYLVDKYSVAGINLLRFDGKLQFATNPKYVEQISAVLNPIRERAFSQSMLEVAAIVAYKQPVTRLEIEKIRGVSSEYAVSALLKQNVIEVVGRKDAVGKPFLFGTTENFLKKFNLSKITDLPEYESLAEKLKEFDDLDSELAEDYSDDALLSPDFLDGEEGVQRIG